MKTAKSTTSIQALKSQFRKKHQGMRDDKISQNSEEQKSVVSLSLVLLHWNSNSQ